MASFLPHGSSTYEGWGPYEQFRGSRSYCSNFSRGYWWFLLIACSRRFSFDGLPPEIHMYIFYIYIYICIYIYIFCILQTITWYLKIYHLLFVLFYFYTLSPLKMSKKWYNALYSFLSIFNGLGYNKQSTVFFKVSSK